LTKKEIDLSHEQQDAVDMCLDRQTRMLSVTGRAGTGKTSVLGIAFRDTALQAGRDKVILCAPTGRAAKRITELTGIKAKTIHKLLEFPEPDDEDEDGKPLPPEPRRNRDRPLYERVIYVDESSMLSQQLYDQLMAALPSNGRIRFFGDNEQLPPVDKGAPFGEMLKTKAKKELTFCFRSDDEIISNAERIRAGRIPMRNHRFEIVYTNNPIKTLIGLVDRNVCQQNTQIIMPTRNGNYGTARVNPSLQLKFNPTGDILRVERSERLAKQSQDPPIALRGGDKFLWVRNDYTLKLFNGETGFIDWVNSEDGSLQISMDGRTLVVPPFIQAYSPYHGSIIHYDPRKKIELGYAVTTHKAQGSEFDTVIYCMSRGSPRLLNRRNFYTAVTRARHNVVVVCDSVAMGKAMRRYVDV
jgi:exodeoxyribonuclease V alpha subunit